MKRLLALLAMLLLSGCASPPPPPLASHLLHDALFAPPDPAIGAARIFALSDEMKHYAAQIVSGKEKHQRQRLLFDALYRKDQLKLEYDAAITRNAEQTFTARRGNCLSLVIMTAAFARELGLTVQFQQLAMEETWSRSGNMYFASGHVNLTLSRSNIDDGRTYDANKFLLIDFQPPENIERMVAIPIDERVVVAMYMNNRAAESLVQERMDDAYWWARKALEYDPRFVNAYNTLGVVYQRHGNLPQAEAALRHAARQQPDSTVPLSNLARVLTAMGNDAEAAAVQAQIARMEPYPPFHYFHLGQQAMARGDYRRARALFERELARAPDYHEFHFALASAAAQLGDWRTADEHLRLAMENSTTRGDHDLYAGKLDRLKAHGPRKPPAYSN